MAFYLLNWRKFHGDCVNVPDKVLSATNDYKRLNDMYRQFATEHIRTDPRKSIRVSELYEMFKIWYKEGFPNRQLPNKCEVKTYFERAWGKPKGNMWKGYYYINPDAFGGEDVDPEL